MDIQTKKKLIDWNYHDSVNDTNLNLINFQKSALDLELINIDESRKLGEFSNERRKFKNRDLSNTATLYSCDCKSFNYAGNSPKKKFVPCMHIYRLAIELGIMIPKHFKSTKSSYTPLSEEEKTKRKAQRLAEVRKMRQMPADVNQWGSWNRALHLEKAQQERIVRAIEITKHEQKKIRKNGPYWVIQEYGCSLMGCDCEDFSFRKLPCKHIYAAASISGEILEILN